MWLPALIAIVLYANLPISSQKRISDAGLALRKLSPRSAHNLTINSPSWTSFVTTTAITCNADTAQLKCPPRMHIQPVSVNAHPEIPPSTSILGAVNSKCFWSEAERNTYNQVYRRYSSKCLRTDAHMHVRHTCEGRYSCNIFGSQLQDNSTDCKKHNFPIRIDYQCLPDPDTTLFEAICADTYMEVKCDGRSLAVAVLAARLEQKIDQVAGSQRPGCQMVPGDGINVKCQTSFDVAESLQLACNGQSSCSISPNAVGGNTRQPGTCGKMHLSLTYVCVPPEWIVMNKQTLQLSEPKKRSKTQRLPKGAVSNKLLTNPEETRHNRYKMNDHTNLKPDSGEDEEELNQDIRKTPVAEKSARDLNPEQLTSAAKPVSGKGIFQPLFIGLGVGAGILLLGLTCLIVFCQNHRVPTHRLKQSHDDPKMHHKSQDNRTCSSSCNSTWHKHSVSCPHDHQWAELNRHCHTCLVQDETRPQCSPVELSCGDNELHPSAPFGNMQESYLHRHHSPFCNPTPTPNLPLPVTQLSGNGSQMTAEGFLSNAPDIQYMMAIRAETTPNETTNPFILDQYSINQSNSSSSGVGLNGTPIGYGPPFSMNLSSIASTELRNNRFDSSLYSGNPALKCSSAGGSSSGRGCDGGSGVSETSEAVQCNPQNFKHFYSGPYAGIAVPVEYSPRVFGKAYPDPTESGLTMPVTSSNAYSIMNSRCLPEYQHYLHKSSVPESDYGQSITSAHSSVSTVSKQRSNAPVRRPSFRTALDINTSLTSTLMRDKHSEENEMSNTTHSFAAIKPNPSEQAHCNGTEYILARRQSQRGRYSPIADEDERAMTPNTNRSRSTESLTEPLLEPPTNFRTTPVRHSNDFECPNKKHESTPENREQSISKPPDLILKTKNASNFAELDDTDLPPPPIAPLRVLSTTSNRISVPSDSRIRMWR